MLTVKKLMDRSKTPPKRKDRNSVPDLYDNSTRVSISFGKTTEGKGPKGFYYRSIPGRALSAPKGKEKKKQKTFEIRIYYPKTASAKDQYIPLEFRKGKYIGPQKAPEITQNNYVWLSCNCEYFLYHCEVADTFLDSSTMLHSNGAWPFTTNPNGIPHLCKHLIAAINKGALKR